jgi:ATP-dependent DNA helicase RecG
MNIERVKRLLKQKENIRLEFKEAVTALPGNLFETICAMLNRDGGDIILGVQDNGTVIGVNQTSIPTMVTNLVNLSNNNQKLDPAFILYPQTYQLKGKFIIHIQVPASSQVHKTVGIVYDRSNDGDFKVTAPHQVADIYNRKRNHYTEGIIYPAVRFEDLNESLFPKVRNLIKSNNANHPWLALNDVQLLQKAGLWKRDFQTGQEGFTLGAVLLLGKDETIQQVVPHYKIDALVRVQDKLRYDDREYIQTNLIDAYEQLMAFVAKHLPDKFYLEGSQRISLRTTIFREIIANIITHREYTNALPTTIIIKQDAIETENANNPHGNGPISPDAFTPFPKNPTIAKFMMQLGWVEELFWHFKCK